ncbi:MAG: A/G-specific adenine glycosylase [Bacteroidia bacterium]
MSEALREALRAWYDEEGRRFVWRETQDPYRIWIAETFLQQTQIAQVERRLLAFLARYPTLKALVEAEESEVLRLWQGLGYYQRVHNLLRAAQALWQQGGWTRITESTDPLRALLALPGIGPYTARAILSFARWGAYLPVDGNVARILSRLWGDPTPLGQRHYYQKKADALPETWRQPWVAFALMDLARLVCLPRRPRCETCPLRAECQAFHSGKPAQFPAPRPTKPKPIQQWIFLIYATPEAVWLERRPAKGLWGGLWCLPLERPTQPLPNSPVFRHAFSHFQLWGYVKFLSAPLPATNPVAWSELERYALPAPIRRLLQRLAFSPSSFTAELFRP